MEYSSYVNWIASLNFDEALILLVMPIAAVAGIGALLVRLFLSELIGTASTVGTSKVGIAAEIYGVVLGFVVLFGLDHFGDTQRAVLLEASLVERLRAEAQFFPGDKSAFIQAIDDYVDAVLNHEWPRQEEGDASSLITGGIRQLDKSIRVVTTELDSRGADRIFGLVDEINLLRVTRLSATPDAVVSTAIFQMVAVGLLLSVVTGWFVRGPSILIHMGLSAMVAGSIVTLTVLSAQLAYPFTGAVAIPKSTFSELVQNQAD